MATSNMLTLLCIHIGIMLIVVSGSPERCPSVAEIGCRSDPLPCQAPRSVPLLAELELKDGTKCPACTLCSQSADVCPPVACPIFQLPPECTRHIFYDLYITLEKSGRKCWACDHLRCLEDGEEV